MERQYVTINEESARIAHSMEKNMRTIWTWQASSNGT